MKSQSISLTFSRIMSEKQIWTQVCLMPRNLHELKFKWYYVYICVFMCVLLIYHVTCTWRPSFQITFSISLSPSSLSHCLPLCSFWLLTNPAYRLQNASRVSGVSEHCTSYVILTDHPGPGRQGSWSWCQRAWVCRTLLSLSFLSLGKSHGTSESQLPCPMR